MIYEFRDSTCENNSYYTYSIWYKESWEGNAYFVYLKNDFMHPEIPEFILLYKKDVYTKSTSKMLVSLA